MRAKRPPCAWWVIPLAGVKMSALPRRPCYRAGLVLVNGAKYCIQHSKMVEPRHNGC